MNLSAWHLTLSTGSTLLVTLSTPSVYFFYSVFAPSSWPLEKTNCASDSALNNSTKRPRVREEREERAPPSIPISADG